MLCVALWATDSVARLDREGQTIDEVVFLRGSEPHGVAVAADGSVWVALEAGCLVHLTT
jgi:virginiamycin B lyase